MLSFYTTLILKPLFHYFIIAATIEGAVFSQVSTVVHDQWPLQYMLHIWGPVAWVNIVSNA